MVVSARARRVVARLRGLRWVSASLFVGWLGGCEDFISEPAVSLQLDTDGPWPTTVPVGTIVNLGVTVTHPSGGMVTGVTGRWHTGDSTVLVPSDVGLSDSVGALESSFVALDTGSVAVTFSVEQAGLADVDHVDTIVVTAPGWSTQLPVSGSTEVSVGLSGVAGSVGEAIRVGWSATDPGIIRLDSAGPLTATVRALARGSSVAVAEVTRDGVEKATFRFPFVVSPMTLRQLPGSTWPTQLRTTVRDTVEVEAIGVDSIRIQSVPVEWSSEDLDVIRVTKIDARRAEIEAVGVGEADVIVVTDSVGLESSELRIPVTVLQGWQSVSAGGWYVPGSLSYIAAQGGQGHTCALTPARALYCWGSSRSGQVGNGVAGAETAVRLPTEPALPLQFSSVSVGGAHTCALVATSAFCWGENADGRVGDQTTIDRVLPTQVVLGGASLTVVSAGASETCAVENYQPDDSFPPMERLLCWGGATVGGGEYLQDVDVGGDHGCYLFIDLECSGENQAGQLGDGSTTSTNDPVLVLPAMVPTDFSVGADHTCALSSSGTISCWGSNQWGQLGGTTNQACAVAGDLYLVPTIPCSRSPVDVGSSVQFDQVTAGFGFTCALSVAYEAFCWGRNDRGQLGVDSTQASLATPTPVAGGHLFTDIDAGFAHACGVTVDKALYCWGANTEGRLGDGAVGVQFSRFEPAPVLVLEPGPS